MQSGRSLPTCCAVQLCFQMSAGKNVIRSTCKNQCTCLRFLMLMPFSRSHFSRFPFDARFLLMHALLIMDVPQHNKSKPFNHSVLGQAEALSVLSLIPDCLLCIHTLFITRKAVTLCYKHYDTISISKSLQIILASNNENKLGKRLKPHDENLWK